MTSTIGNERNPFNTVTFDSQLSAITSALSTVRDAVGDGPGRNLIINGNFDVWQRGTTQSTSGYGSDDRWRNNFVGTTSVHSQQAFTLGQTAVPGNPTYFSRTVVSSVAGAGNNAGKVHCIEGVSTLSGKTATLTFWAKADAGRNIAVEFQQSFGAGGSPSALVNTIGSQKVSLTTSWQKFSLLVSIPSIAGKTLGTSGTDRLELVFWFDAGTNFDARTSALGQQSGTFDIARVSVVEGDATLEADPFSPRPIGQEIALCQRYFYAMGPAPAGETPYQTFGLGMIVSNTNTYVPVQFPVTMRAVPTVTSGGTRQIVSNGVTAAVSAVALLAGTGSRYSATLSLTNASSSASSYAAVFRGGNDTTAYIWFDAEL